MNISIGTKKLYLKGTFHIFFGMVAQFLSPQGGYTFGQPTGGGV